MLLSLLETILVTYLMEKHSKADLNLQDRNEGQHKQFQAENSNTGENYSTLQGLKEKFPKCFLWDVVVCLGFTVSKQE